MFSGVTAVQTTNGMGDNLVKDKRICNNSVKNHLVVENV